MAAYHTWNWLRAPTGAAARPDTSVQAVIEQVVEARLTEMGYQKSDTNPEFRVGWHAALGDPLEVTSVNNYYGCAWGRWFPGGGVVYSHGFQTQFEPGSLVLDVADSRARELIWRGIGRGVFQPEGERLEARKDRHRGRRRAVRAVPAQGEEVTHLSSTPRVSGSLKIRSPAAT